MKLWIRADAWSAIGLGHVMRCAALAQSALRRSLDATFLIHDPDDIAMPRMASLGLHAQSLPNEGDARWLEEIDAGDLVVFDGYHFSAADFQAAAGTGARIVALDDDSGGHVPVDVILNTSNPHASYSGPQRALLGPGFALVRNEFTQLRRRRGTRTDRLLVALGGTAPPSLVGEVVELLRDGSFFPQVLLVTGTSAIPPGDAGCVEMVASPEDVAAVFDRADVAISAAGNTAWELLTMGMPCVLTSLVPNQRYVLATAVERGAALGLDGTQRSVTGWPPLLRRLRDVEAATALSDAALALVDGGGADRVLDEFLAILHER